MFEQFIIIAIFWFGAIILFIALFVLALAIDPPFEDTRKPYYYAGTFSRYGTYSNRYSQQRCFDAFSTVSRLEYKYLYVPSKHNWLYVIDEPVSAMTRRLLDNNTFKYVRPAFKTYWTARNSLKRFGI